MTIFKNKKPTKKEIFKLQKKVLKDAIYRYSDKYGHKLEVKALKKMKKHLKEENPFKSKDYFYLKEEVLQYAAYRFSETYGDEPETKALKKMLKKLKK